jgi:proteasome beta subunit
VGTNSDSGRRPAQAFMEARIPSFTDFLASYAPDLLPGDQGAGQRVLGPQSGGGDFIKDLPHATTIVTATCERGVVIAGDRRATMGSMIAKRDVEKVFRSDEFSAMGFAGTGSLGLEFARLFEVELEHYEKMEGRQLSLEGKANQLASMVRGNIGGAMQGLVWIPLFAGYDEEAGTGRIFSYDPVGGPYEEYRFYSIGSGSVFARGSLKKLYRDGMPVRDAVLACVQALYDAADDDSATGGPDVTRRIYPIIATITDDGFRRLPDAESAEIAQQVVSERMQSPDGPPAPVRSAS